MGELQAVEALPVGLSRALGQRPERRGRAAREGFPRRHQAVQHEHAHVGSRVACGERLAVRPHAENGIAAARVELGNHRDPRSGSGGHHHDLCVASVASAIAAGR